MQHTHRWYNERQAEHHYNQRPTLALKHEFIRKAIHIIFTSSLVLALYVPFGIMLAVLAGTFFIILFFERVRRGTGLLYMRLRGILRQFGLLEIIRTDEAQSYTGATFLVFASLLCFLIFPIQLYVLSFLVAGWADAAAAIIGRLFGKHSLGYSKSLEGSISFFGTAILITSISVGIWESDEIFLLIGTVAAGAATFAELLSTRYRIDDNLAVPLTFGLVFQALSYLPLYWHYFNH